LLDHLSEIIYWNQQGLIPGPEETKEDFEKRAHFCLNLQKHLAEQANLPFTEDDHDQNFLHEAFVKTQLLYGIAPTWTPVFFSNYQLTPWHAGCAWIFQIGENTPMAAFLQLRSQFRKKSTYLGLYQRSELMAHELAHVGRMLYQEPQFEEILAYRSSISPWRRWLGPIIQSSKESLFFILLLGLLIMTNLASMTLNYTFMSWLNLLPLILITIALIRLSQRQRQFTDCLKKLEALYGSLQIAQHLIYRLSDKEIKFFAASNPLIIKNFIKQQLTHSFRWGFLHTIYPFKED
jgi:hypothetical protein